ncbi:MAG: DNA repair protein RadA [Parasporobacterium sp.]|nr:DNA repair protein RadA [Parasporobacterium sp.]
MAKKTDTIFFCKECGFESPKWSGQCPSCKEWNSMVEASAKDVEAKHKKSAGIVGVASLMSDNKPSTMSEVAVQDEHRMETGIEEFDRVLGGGIVEGSLVLVGGDPGIGKSTLLTQVCKALSDKDHSVLYISGEESLKQIKLRANRLGEFNDNLKLLCETDLNSIADHIKTLMPDVCIIDSIQTMFNGDTTGVPGSPSQVRECTGMLLNLAKGLGVSIFVVGHVTKEGVVAGPRMLEHMVDTVLYFEGDAGGVYRILRGVKNRFGSTNEIGVFEMCREGLKEVKNPSEYMISERPKDASGSVVSCALEGTRPILIEIQALVAKSGLGNPRRSATGLDYNRLNLLLAVLEKRLGFRCSECDAYVNIVGGIRINETATDLAVILALASAYMDFSVPQGLMAMGEVGLSGEVRNIAQGEIRIGEAKKLGFDTVIAPKGMASKMKPVEGIKVIAVENVRDAINKVKALADKK